MHREVVKALEMQVQEHQAIANERIARLEQLQESYAAIATQVDAAGDTHTLAQKELDTHKDLVVNLENQLQVHKSAIAIHQESLESLQAAHSQEVDELKASIERLQRDSAENAAAQKEQHEQVTSDLRNALATAHNENSQLIRNASTALGYETDPSKLHSQIRGLVEEGKELHNRHLKTTNDLKAVQEELQNAINRSVEMESQVNEIKLVSEERALHLEKMSNKYAKSSRLVEELEEQLNSNFDSHQATNKRLSTMQSETVQARMELERELEEHKIRNSTLEVCQVVVTVTNTQLSGHLLTLVYSNN
jgi:kinesin family protein 4/21/27